jgi:lysophospholipase L1-like esterase
MPPVALWTCLIVLWSALAAPAASVNLSLAQSATGSSKSVSLDLTAEGGLDWGIFTGDDTTPASISPSQRKSGASAFVSLGSTGGAVNETATFPNPTRLYSWTNGNPTTSGNTSALGHERLVLGANGAGSLLTIQVPSAGSYRLVFYTAVYDVQLQGVATLASGATRTVNGTAGSGLQDFVWTVDFTTDAADTLTLAVTRSGDTNSIYAIEAFHLKQSAAQPVLSIAPSAQFNNNYTAQSYTIPFQNTGQQPLSISSVTMGGADAAYFSPGAVTSPVLAGGSGVLNFNFNPTGGARIYQATITVNSNDPVSPAKSVAVSVLSSPNQLGRLLCIGDSITEASGTRPAGNGNWSWRYPFWKRCVDAGVGVEFVGTRTSNNGGASSYPAYSGQSFSNRHEAIWGTSAQERDSSAATYLGTLAGSGKTPDTAVIFCGGNDLPQNLSGSPATVRDRIKSIVDKLQGDVGSAGNPSIRILLVGILPRYINGPAYETPDPRNSTHFAELNVLLQTLAANETTGISKVTYVDTTAPFTNDSTLFYDGVHPGGAGEQIIGDAIFGVLVPDSDVDALPDSWERAYYPNLAAANSGSDTDRDGMIALDEFVFGGSPTASNLPPSIQLQVDAGRLVFTLPVAAGAGYEGKTRSYTVQQSTTLQEQDWSDVASGAAAAGEITVPVANSGTRAFFRLKVWLD